MLGDVQKIKNYLSSFRDFPGKADSVKLLGFECTINTQNLNKIVRAIFGKIEILNFFLMLTTLNFGGRSKTEKQTEDICKGTSNVEFEQDWSFRLGAMLGDGQKIKTIFLVSGIFREKPIVSYCWISNVL